MMKMVTSQNKTVMSENTTPLVLNIFQFMVDKAQMPSLADTAITQNKKSGHS
jgi:hypothetical protein